MKINFTAIIRCTSVPWLKQRWLQLRIKVFLICFLGKMHYFFCMWGFIIKRKIHRSVRWSVIEGQWRLVKFPSNTTTWESEPTSKVFIALRCLNLHIIWSRSAYSSDTILIYRFSQIFCSLFLEMAYTFYRCLHFKTSELSWCSSFDCRAVIHSSFFSSWSVWFNPIYWISPWWSWDSDPICRNRRYRSFPVGSDVLSIICIPHMLCKFFSAQLPFFSPLQAHAYISLQMISRLKKGYLVRGSGFRPSPNCEFIISRFPVHLCVFDPELCLFRLIIHMHLQDSLPDCLKT